MSDMADKITELYKMMAMPLLGVLGGAAVLFGIWIGVGFIMADGDDQKLKKAKSRVKTFVIGWIVMFAIAALLPMFIGVLQTWAQG